MPAGDRQVAEQRVIHLHPTLRCNLTCAHCYSSSSPARRDDVDLVDLSAALGVLAGMGYTTVSISGGEPFLFRGMVDLVRRCRDLGLRVHVITNGTVRPPRSWPGIAELFDLVAVSLDGTEERHDRIRGRRGSFDKATQTLEGLAWEGVPTAVVSCVTRGSLPELPDLYEHCDGLGVRLLSLRPLVGVGRGSDYVGEHLTESLGSADLLRLRVLAALLDAEGLRVRADVTTAGEARSGPALTPTPGMAGGVAAAVNPLVICEDGTVLPYVHGLHPRFALGHISGGARGLAESIDRALPRVAELLQEAADSLPAADEECLDWFAHLLATSQRTGEELALSPAR